LIRFEDEETRRIMRVLASQPDSHFRDLMRRTGVAQNSLNQRLEKLKRAGYVREKRLRQQRQFCLTKKGYRGTYEDGTQQGKEFLEFLRQTAYGKQLLEHMDWLEREMIRLYGSHEYERLDKIERRLAYLASRGDKIDEVKEAVRITRNALQKLAGGEEKVDAAEGLHLLFHLDEEVINYIRALGFARFGVDLVFREEKANDWMQIPEDLVAEAKRDLDADRTEALAIIQAINALPSSRLSEEQLERQYTAKTG